MYTIPGGAAIVGEGVIVGVGGMGVSVGVLVGARVGTGVGTTVGDETIVGVSVAGTDASAIGWRLVVALGLGIDGGVPKN
jgi:hypothetical protein